MLATIPQKLDGPEARGFREGGEKIYRSLHTFFIISCAYAFKRILLLTLEGVILGKLRSPAWEPIFV